MTTTLTDYDDAATTTPELTQHPACALLPAIPDDEYAELRDDIGAHGQYQPIVLLDGKVLDGWHRYRACAELGLEPRIENFTGDEYAALTYVISMNLRHRHLTASQKAAFAVQILPMLEEAARKRQVEAGRQFGTGHPKQEVTADSPEVPAGQELTEIFPEALVGEARRQAAALTGTNERYVSDAKRIAEQAPDVLEAVKTGQLNMTTAKAAAKLPEETRTKVLSGLDTTTPAARKAARREIEHASRTLDQPDITDRTEPAAELCDIREGSVVDALLLSPGSVDWVITDPPYVRRSLDVWRDLGKVAAHVLRPGGALIAMSGQYHLPKVLGLLAENLEYLWTIAYLTPGGTATYVFPRRVNSFWKPVFVFGRPGDRYAGPAYGDVAKSPVNGGDKTHHHWGQSEAGMHDLMRRFVKPGQVVLDPFLGGGTTAVVALDLQAKIIGFDVDPAAIETTRGRVDYAG